MVVAEAAIIYRHAAECFRGGSVDLVAVAEAAAEVVTLSATIPGPENSRCSYLSGIRKQ